MASWRRENVKIESENRKQADCSIQTFLSLKGMSPSGDKFENILQFWQFWDSAGIPL